MRDNSSSSAITAIRQNSGMRSTDHSLRNASKSSRSSEAITAAMRAIAGSGKSTSKIPKKSL
jgi:hypothetical protein